MNNKKIGNAFETELCELLTENGYWAHNFANKSYGQPADVIAVKRQAYLIDCKVCSGRRGFDTRRIEDNQHDAMTKWLETCSTTPVFIIKFEATGEIYVIGYPYMTKHPDEVITQDMIRKVGYTLEEWLSWSV